MAVVHQQSIQKGTQDKKKEDEALLALAKQPLDNYTCISGRISVTPDSCIFPYIEKPWNH